MKKGFEYESQFNTDNAFTSIKFGYDRPILETELNEMQEIQNHNRKLLMHKICKSGIIELVDRDFTGDKIVYNPYSPGTTIRERNKIAIAPMKVNVNGYEVHVCGGYEINGLKTYVDIDLGEAPSGGDYASQYRQDLVFLQVWFDDINANSIVNRYGNVNGPQLDNVLVDDRVGDETSHRIGLKWKIRVANFVDFNTWEYGFGFNNSSVNGYSPILTDITSGINLFNSSIDSVFANATHYMFKGCNFYGDNNLWVAGRPNPDDPTNTKDKQFVFAIPLFRIDRRNKKAYTLNNPNGSMGYDDTEINLRPDGKCYDMIYESDITDLRKSVIINNNEFNYYLDNTLEDLFTGNLTTKSSQQMRRIQFGIRPIDATAPNIRFLDSFNPDRNPVVGNTPVVQKRNSGITIDYSPSVTQWGVNMTGDVQFQYTVNNINSDEGTFDFFLIPSWNGIDQITQYICGLYEQFGNAFLTISKINNKLEVKRYADTSSNPKVSTMYININKILSNKIYHFRICWSVINNKLECYINGNFAGNSLDPYLTNATFMNITKLYVGNIETIPSGSTVLDSKIGFIMDELAIYNGYYGNSNWTLPQDYIKGNALILPSFNGIFRNYRDNQYEQKNMTNQILSTANTTKITISSPYETTFSSSTPKIYCIATTASTPSSVTEGTEIIGSWSGLNTNNLTFTLNTTAITGFTKFTGEKFAIVYGVILPGGNTVEDIPNEILRSENTNIETNITNEVSFNIENNTGTINSPREIDKLITAKLLPNGTYSYTGRRYIYDVHDNAYDFSTYRDLTNKDYCFARLLEFYVEGNGTNTYNIDAKQYGYDVLYVRQAYIVHNNISGIETVTPLNIIGSEYKVSANDTNSYIYAITVNHTIYSGDKIKFELALGGTTFDYNNNSKTFVGNVCQARFLEFDTSGDKYIYNIPLNKMDIDGLCNNGIILSLGTLYSYSLDSSGNEIDNLPNDYHGDYICYRNNKLYKYTYIDGLNKPFLQLRISQIDAAGNELKLPAGEKIKIPIFATYQPTSKDILSVWYNYIPYQGVLNNSSRKLRRLSDWKIFITTLSSGNLNDKFNNVYSINNLINRLPGGISSSPLITGQDINLSTHNFESFEEIENYTLNKKLIFIDQTYIGTKNEDIDSYFFNLDTKYIVSKEFGEIQDDTIIFKDTQFKIYLPMINNPINKYCGMACVVSDEFGDLYLLIVGDSNNNLPTISNSISPKYGDLFIIPNRPGLINRI